MTQTAAPGRRCLEGKRRNPRMEATTLRMFCELAYAKAGIALDATKEPLIAARIAKRIRALGLLNEEEYLAVLTGREGEQELVNFPRRHLHQLYVVLSGGGALPGAFCDRNALGLRGTTEAAILVVCGVKRRRAVLDGHRRS